MKLTLPLTEQPYSFNLCRSKPKTGTFNARILQHPLLKRAMKWFVSEDENYGSEAFLANAREILIRLKTSEDNEQRQEDLMREKMNRKKSLDDRIKNIEMILQHSFPQPSTSNPKTEFMPL